MASDNNIQFTNDLRQAVSDIKRAIVVSQSRALRMISGQQLSLYYGIGIYVSDHSRTANWGTGAIDAISKQLKREMPGLRGFSSESIKKMRTFTEFWSQYINRSAVTTELPSAEICSPVANYMQILDDKIRKPHENPTIGIVLCKEMNRSFAEYAVRDYSKPMGVATYRTQDDMPEPLRKSFPNLDDMAKLL